MQYFGHELFTGQCALLQDLLCKHAASSCADPRDKVYALLGMAYDVQEAWINRSNALKPDYKRDIVDVFWDTYKSCNVETLQFWHTLFMAMSSSTHDLMLQSHCPLIRAQSLSIDQLMLRALERQSNNRADLNAAVVAATATQSLTLPSDFMFHLTLKLIKFSRQDDLSTILLAEAGLPRPKHGDLVYLTQIPRLHIIRYLDDRHSWAYCSDGRMAEEQ
jgi:hypothetical protein